MQTTIEQRFRSAVRNFIHSPKKAGNNRDAVRAKVFIEQEEPELARLFLLDQTERLMRIEERAAERASEAAVRADDPQMKLAGPGFAELFTGFSQRLPVKNGHKVQLRLMTVTQMRESAAELRARAKKRVEKSGAVEDRRAQWLDEMADQISPHAQAHRRLKFGDYLDLVRDGVIAAPALAKAAR